MKKYDVNIEIVGAYGERLLMIVEDIEAENTTIAKTLALSYAKSMIKFNVTNVKELT